METITGSTVEQYLYDILPPRDSVLEKMEAEARNRAIPIVGPLVGRFLHQLARIHRAKKIFEMGSAIGYSTIWWARAVGHDGEVHYTDGNSRNAAEAEANFKEAKVAGIVKVHVGNALDLLDSVPGEFDIIFCDIDKGDYPKAFEKAVPRLKKGGLFAADNVLWGGSVALPPDSPVDLPGGREWTDAIRKFNKLLYETPGLFTTIIPLRDGVSVSVKM